jgi:hypothetical protein
MTFSRAKTAWGLLHLFLGTESIFSLILSDKTLSFELQILVFQRVVPPPQQEDEIVFSDHMN